MMDGMGMMMWPSILFGVLLVVLLVVAGIAAVKRLGDGKSMSLRGDGENATELLKKRYARGEIGKDEFERIRKDIE